MSSSRQNLPIIIYQMGKVGSRTVYETLFDLKLGVPIYHCHVLNDLDSLAEGIKKQVVNPETTLEVIEQGRELRQLIDDIPDQWWNIISLVRDPVAQDISSFFQGIEQVIPDIQSKLQNNAIDIGEICTAFLEKWPHHHAAEQWFDAQLTPVFNIDVFSQTFPIEKGYDIFEIRRFSLLVIRLEDLDACMRPALKEFLGISDFKIIKSNTAGGKWYRHLYKYFISRVALPEDYLNMMYSSKFSTHFYTPKELQKFRSRWSIRALGKEDFNNALVEQEVSEQGCSLENTVFEVLPLDKNSYGKIILANFDWQYYLSANADVAQVCKTAKKALNHFVLYGYREGRPYNNGIGKAFDQLDARYYMSRYPELGLKQELDARVHYLTEGYYEDRYTNPRMEFERHPYSDNMLANFDWEYYLRANAGVAQVCKTEEEALNHFVSNGYREGRPYNSDLGKALQHLRYQYYIGRYPELGLKQDAEALIHYASSGYYEDRFANPETEIHYNAQIHIVQTERNESEAILDSIKRKINCYVVSLYSKDHYAWKYPKVCLPYEKILVHPRKQRCKVITGVGEVVSSIIALFFEDFELRGQDPAVLTLEQATEALCTHLDSIALRVIHSFDYQYFCGLDVYDMPFNIDSKYAVLSNDYLRLFLYRRENLQEISTALGEFIGNSSLEVEYAEKLKVHLPIVREIMDQFVLPEEKLKKLYSARYMRHFYLPSEIDALIKYWSRPRKIR